MSALREFIDSNKSIFSCIPRDAFNTITTVVNADKLKHIVRDDTKEAINVCDALEQMRQQERQEGVSQKEEAIVKKMLSSDFDLSVIEQMTEVPMERILQIKRDNKL